MPKRIRIRRIQPLTVATASYALTGRAAVIGRGVSTSMPATTRSYAWTGKAINLLGRTLQAVSRPYFLTGRSAILTGPAPVAGAASLTSFTIAGSGTAPFTVGMPFKSADVPAGSTITANCPTFQADVRNRWADGSVRFAVLSGTSPTGTVTVARNGTAYSASDVAEPTGFDAAVSFTGVVDANSAAVAGGSFSATLSTARIAGTGIWARTSARKVRQIPGPVMSEFHYFCPTADAHTHVWFYVRAYATGAIEVETAVENGWLQVAAPGRRDYSVSLTINGVQRYAGAGLVQYHHTRWSRVDWVGADPTVTVAHNVAYLQTIRGMPKLAVSALTSGAYTAQPESGIKYTSWTRALGEQPAPFTIANFDPALGSGGFSDNVNLFAPWDMTYLVEADPRAYWAIQGNSRAAGRFCVHYRDEATGKPVRGSEHLTLGLSDTSVGISENAGNQPILTPAPTGGAPTPNWYYTHGPALGFMAYLTSGRWTALDECEFYASAQGFTQGGNAHFGFRIAPWYVQLRNHAWSFRDYAQAAIIAPAYLNGVAVTGQEASQRIDAVGRLEADVAYYHGAYITNTYAGATPRQMTQNVFGLWYQDQDYDETGDGIYTLGGMMQSYNSLAVMWAFDAEASSNSQLADLAAFCARWPVGTLGGIGSTWDWRIHTAYQWPIANGGYDAAQFGMGVCSPMASWDAAWTRITTGLTWQPSNPFPLVADNNLRGFFPGTSDITYQMGTLTSPAILALSSSNNVATLATVAMAHSIADRVTIPGIDTAAAHFYGSDNWLGTISGGQFQANPQWAYTTRRAVGLPAWVPTTVGASALVAMTNTLDSVVTSGVWSGNGGAANFADYSGGVFNRYWGNYGAHIIHGGGHAATNDNSVFLADYNDLTFKRVGGPTVLASSAAYETAITTGVDSVANPREVASGVPGAAHTYDCLLVLPPSVCGDAKGALIRPVAGAIGMQASRETGYSHVFTFTGLAWSRWSTNNAGSWTPGGSVAYDTTRGKLWPIADSNMAFRPSLDLASRTWTNASLHPGLNSYPDMVFTAYEAQRDVVVIGTCDSVESTLRFFWFAGSSDGSARTPVTFTQGALPHARWGRGSLVYVPELLKLVYWTQANQDVYYEITVPATPSGAWSWVAKAITGAGRPSLLASKSFSTYKRMDYAPNLKSLMWVAAKDPNTFSFGGQVICVRIVP